MASTNWFRSARRWLLCRLEGRQVVGSDKNGNIFYTINAAGIAERRLVEYESSWPDPNQLPVQWRLWLQKQRQNPPTVEEMETYEREFVAYRKRVEAVEKKDRRLQIQERAERLRENSMDNNGSQTDLDSFLQSWSKVDKNAKS